MSQHQAGFAEVPVKRLKQPALTWKGAVHKLRHAILANFDPPFPLVTLCHTSRNPPKVRHTSRTTSTPRFLVGLVQKALTKAPCTNSLSIVRGGFCPGFCLLSGRFCPFPLLSGCMCYNRKLNITLNLMFHIYDKRIYKRDVTCSLPSLCHKLSHPLGPPTPSSVTYFMDGPKVKDKATSQLARSYARLRA